MPRSTLFLITALVLTTVILFLIALWDLRQPQRPDTAVSTISPTLTNSVSSFSQSPTDSISDVSLTLSPDTLSLSAYQQGTIGIVLASGHPITSVQLEIAYDQNLFANFLVSPSSIGQTPLVLVNKPSTQSGRLSYTIGVSSKEKPLMGIKQIATINFTPVAPSKSGTLRILSSSVIILQNNQVATLGSSASATITTSGTNPSPIPSISVKQ